MQGLMQDWPLLVPTILDHARLYHPEREVVSRSVEVGMAQAVREMLEAMRRL